MVTESWEEMGCPVFLHKCCHAVLLLPHGWSFTEQQGCPVDGLEWVLCWRQGSGVEHPKHMPIPRSQHAWRGWLPSRERLLVFLGWLVPKGPPVSPIAFLGDFWCSLRAQNTGEELGCSELPSVGVHACLLMMGFPPHYTPAV